MKKVNNCFTDNCIENQSSCTIWNGGDIEYLGLCNGISINNVFWEIITKLQDIAGADLSNFDIDSLIDICSQKAPSEINLLNVLNIIKNNEICLKDYIKNLEERISELNVTGTLSLNLKCYADFDNLGNALQINQEQLNQLLVNIACDHKSKIEGVEGKIIGLQLQIDNILNDNTVEEQSFGTCVDPGIKPTSTQVKNIATAFCAHETAVGTPNEVQIALAQTPVDFETDFALVDPANWIPVINRSSLADNYNNLLIAFGNVVTRLKYIEDNCCRISCDDIILGFNVRYNEDRDGIIITFTSGSGTSIPSGFTDAGSTITLTDAEGGQITNVIDIADLFYNNGEFEIPIATLSTIGDIEINIDAKLTNGAVTCDKCLNKSVKRPGCAYCTLTATDNVTIVYKICVTT